VTASGQVTHEEYTPGYGDTVVDSYAQRTAVSEAAFFVPHLTAGMRLLDCGSGPGTITVGLARAVDPGQVIGIDVDAGQVERARAHAAELGVTNVSFQVASVYELPFDRASFDAVFAHAVLQHLREPLAALEQMRRVVRPGGVVGVRDDDAGTLAIGPPSEEMREVTELLELVTRAGGGDPRVGLRHRQLLRQAGFTDIVASATARAHGGSAGTAAQGDVAAALLEHMAPTITASGWATADRVRQLAEACRRWGTDPDAFDVITWCEAVGRA